MKNFKLLFVLPITLLLLVLFSFTEKTQTMNSTIDLSENDLVIGEIVWKGNSKYTDAMLNKFISAREGDIYNKSMVEQSLRFKHTGDDIGSLYMNNGHLYFNVVMTEEVVGDRINLTIEVYEGDIVKVDKIIIKGNNTVSTSEILKLVNIKSGELFNRSKLIQAQKNIAESGFFISDSIGINPIPHQDYKSTDIEFILQEI